jgi:hypothetical protein
MKPNSPSGVVTLIAIGIMSTPAWAGGPATGVHVDASAYTGGAGEPQVSDSGATREELQARLEQLREILFAAEAAIAQAQSDLASAQRREKLAYTMSLGSPLGTPPSADRLNKYIADYNAATFGSDPGFQSQLAFHRMEVANAIVTQGTSSNMFSTAPTPGPPEQSATFTLTTSNANAAVLMATGAVLEFHSVISGNENVMSEVRKLISQTMRQMNAKGGASNDDP